MGAAYFEALYAAEQDPWGFATSPYERAKYDHTLAALGGRRFARGLEVGCSIGVLTAALAERCDRLLAVDVAATAVARARERLAAAPGVTVERRSLPEEMPGGPLRPDRGLRGPLLLGRRPPGARLARASRRARARREPAGRALARPVRHYPQGGDAVHEAIGADAGGLVHAVSQHGRTELPARPLGPP